MTLLHPLKKSAFLLWISLTFALSWFRVDSTAQPFAAFHDNQERFFIFDNGKIIEAEYLPVKGFSVGGRCLLYVDNRNRLKMYYKGEITTLSVNEPEHFTALDYLAVYSIGGIVKIIDEGHEFTVSTNAVGYSAQDSMVTFYDLSRQLLAVYYRGRIEMLEDGLIGNMANQFRSGDNTVAYISSRTKDFKVFYGGENRIIEPFSFGGSFKAGRDIVAFVNNSDQHFKIFFRGEIIEAEDFPPEAWSVGNGICAYIDHTGTFRVFSNGESEDISSVKPDFFRVEDQMVIYGEYGYFKVWYDGQIYTLETYIPPGDNWQADWNSIVYVDINRNVKIFSKGDHRVLTYDLAESVKLYNDVVVVNKGMNNHNVYMAGKKY